MEIRIALVAAALVALTAGAAGAHEAPRQRVITVAGDGEVKVAPDRADVGLVVEAAEKMLGDAERKVSEGVARLLKLCETLGIPKAQIRSAQLSVQPQYDYEGGVLGNRPRIVGYIVSRQVDVELRELSRLGRLLQGAVETGANRVTGPAFSSSKKDEHQRAALALAAEDARANAQRVAKTLGVKLGGLHSLVAMESGAAPPAPMYMMRAKAELAQDAAATYEPGEIRFTASVTADFDLP